MLLRQGRLLLYALIVNYVCQITAFAQSDSNPCTAGPAVLALTDRGGFVNSPCIIPYKSAFLEGGYQYQTYKPSGWLYNLPQGEFRVGLPGNTEFGVWSPNYAETDVEPFSGYNSLIFDFKHPFASSQNWIITGAATFVVPGGNSSFGSGGIGTALSPILTYNLNDQWSLTGTFEIDSFTTPAAEGGERYTVYIPDILLGYSPIEKLNLYVEMYDLSKTGPGEGNALMIDYGLLYMITSKIAIDLGLFNQLTNNPNQFNFSFVGGVTIDLG
ncbi:transporter [Legionella hackeliae]|uniref:Transporter n=1 Tax=Legionella hackeliae TaxID=449 RepID=A0A0A8URY1_LEGHA|nr:transporter [Legionella hackeliae]KTD08848.1 hypothetical protein Lhac_3071 [Legionella hackeliae]CEK10276.1 protein of unknown function [Legionella hackeliae]STX47005.1 Uncharacterised protein [Legionella hackeliae]